MARGRRRVALPPQRPDGLIEQFAGYFDRLDVPVTEWDENNMPRYPAGYHHFNCEDTQLLKQPDVLMALYLLPDVFDAATTRANFEYYEARTCTSRRSARPSTQSWGSRSATRRAPSSTSRVRRSSTSPTTRATPPRACTSRPAGGTWQVLVCGFGGSGWCTAKCLAVAARELGGDPLPAAVADAGCG